MSRKTIEKNISYDESKDLYYVCMNFGKNPDTAKREKIYKTTSSLKEARKMRDKHEAEYKVAKLKEKEYRAPSKLTIKKAIEQYMDVEIRNRQKSTRSTYQTIFDKYFIPWCSIANKTYAKDINRKDVQQYLTWIKEEKELCQNTVAKHYSLLKCLFNMLTKDDIVEKNCVLGIDAPEREATEKDAYELKEISELLKAFEGDRVELAVLLGVFMGLRREEMAGLRWRNVNLNDNYINIFEARLKVDREMVFKGPKSDESKRSLAIPPRVKEHLLKMKQKQEQDKADFGSTYQDSGYVMAWDNGTPYLPNYLYSHYARILKKKELRHITLHDLRKTFATIAIEGNYEVAVQNALGHKPNGVTQTHYLVVHGEHNKRVVMSVSNAIEAEIRKTKQLPLKKVVNGRG